MHYKSFSVQGDKDFLGDGGKELLGGGAIGQS